MKKILIIAAVFVVALSIGYIVTSKTLTYNLSAAVKPPSSSSSKNQQVSATPQKDPCQKELDKYNEARAVYKPKKAEYDKQCPAKPTPNPAPGMSLPGNAGMDPQLPPKPSAACKKKYDELKPMSDQIKQLNAEARACYARNGWTEDK